MGCTCTHQSTAVIPLRDAPLAATTNTPPDPAATADAAATSGAMANARLPQRQPRKGSLKRPIPVTTGTVLLRPITPKPPIASDPWELHPSLRMAECEDHSRLFLPTIGILRQYVLLWKPKSATTPPTKPVWCALNIERRHVPLMPYRPTDRFRMGFCEMFAKPSNSLALKHTKSRSLAFDLKDVMTTPFSKCEALASMPGVIPAHRKPLGQCLVFRAYARHDSQDWSPEAFEELSHAWNRLGADAHALKVYAHRSALVEGFVGSNVMIAAPNNVSVVEFRPIPDVQSLVFDTWFTMAQNILHTLTLAHESGVFYNGIFCPEMIVWDASAQKTETKTQSAATGAATAGATARKSNTPLLSSLPSSPSLSLRRLKPGHHVRAQTSPGLTAALNNLKPPSPNDLKLDDTKVPSSASSTSASPSGIGAGRTIFSRPALVAHGSSAGATAPALTPKDLQQMALADTRAVCRLLLAYLTNEANARNVLADKLRFASMLATIEPIVLVLLAGIVGDLAHVAQVWYELKPYQNQVGTAAVLPMRIAWLCPPLPMFGLCNFPSTPVTPIARTATGATTATAAATATASVSLQIKIPPNKRSLDAWFLANTL